MKFCPYCDKEFKSNVGYDVHVKMCAKHPGDETIRQLVADGISLTGLCHKYGIGHRTGRKWAEVAGADFPPSRKPPLELMDDYAIGFGHHCPCLYYHICAALDGEWTLCEKPDREMLRHDWTEEHFQKIVDAAEGKLNGHQTHFIDYLRRFIDGLYRDQITPYEDEA